MSNLIKSAKSNLLGELPNLDSNSLNYLFSTILLFDLLDKKSKKLHLKKIKKILKNIILNFNEVYLLISDTNFNNNFNLYDNLVFLELFDKLNLILEENKYRKLTNELFNLKSKLELGFQRYFEIDTNKIILNFNSENESFNLLNKKDINKLTNNKNYLIYYLFKKYKNEKFKINLDFQNYFPKYIYKNKNKNEIKILKSLFFKKELDIKELKSKKIYLKDTNSIEIMILIIILNQK